MADKIWIGTDTAGDLNVAANYDPSGVPVATDRLFFDGSRSNQAVTTNLTTFAEVNLAAVHFLATYTGLVGTATTVMDVDATEFFIGEPSGGSNENGSKRLNLETGANVTGIHVYATASSGEDDGMPPLRFVTGAAACDVSVSSGTVGLAFGDALEAFTFDELRVKDGTVLLGDGAVITTDITINDGKVINHGSGTAALVIVDGTGTYETYGSAAHTTIDVRHPGGTIDYRSDGLIGTLKCAGTFDTVNDPRPKTITNCEIYNGAQILADTGNPNSVAFTNGIDLIRCGPEDVTLRLGNHITLTPSVLAT